MKREISGGSTPIVRFGLMGLVFVFLIGGALAPVIQASGEIVVQTNLVYTQDDLSMALDNLLSKSFPNNAPFWEMPRLHPFAEAGDASYRLITPESLTGGRNWFQLRKIDASAKSYLLPVDLFWEDSVWIATHVIKRGQTITPTDLTWRICRHSFLPGEVSFTSSPVGLCARKQIADGSIVITSNLEKPPVIKRGTIVRLLYKSPGLSVSARAEALENGGQGDEIRVRTLDTRKPCRALVMNATEVEVIIP